MMNEDLALLEQRLQQEHTEALGAVKATEDALLDLRAAVDAIKAKLDAVEIVRAEFARGVQSRFTDPAPAVAADVARQIIAELDDEADITAPDLLMEIKKRGAEVTASTMSHFLRRMHEAGELVQVGEGRGSRPGIYRKAVAQPT